MSINFRGFFPSFSNKPTVPATTYNGLGRKRPDVFLKEDASGAKMSGGSKNCDTQGTNADNEGS